MGMMRGAGLVPRQKLAVSRVKNYLEKEKGRHSRPFRINGQVIGRRLEQLPLVFALPRNEY